MNERIHAGTRSLHRENLTSDLAVVGGGLAGVCCAITAARQGLKVVLVQDRPVLGGNASSEVRLWALGATSHMGNNNRWAREGGVIDEILVENLWRNPEGNPVLVDALLLEWVTREPNIELLLNTAVNSLEMTDRGHVGLARAYCSQNETLYTVAAPLFCDASGDGILGYLSGAAFRMGAEAASEFGEGLAGPEPTQELLGHSLYFYSRDTGHPVQFIPPAFALQDISAILRYRHLRVSDSGCSLWWLEYGGDMDTVHGAETIKWELWRVAYGVWNYIKNSGQFPDAANLTLEWMGMIPGKRESRRFEGDYILTQNDIVGQKMHNDAVSFGGWAIDIHPPRGVYSSGPACTQWHAKGVYQIPFRTMYSRNIPNLFLAGRILSTSHIAFGSTRVMATCAHSAQAVGMAASLCIAQNILPRDLLKPERMHLLQQNLLRTGQHIPGVAVSDSLDLARTGHAAASSSLLLSELSGSGEVRPANTACALLLPLTAGKVPAFTLTVDAAAATSLRAELWVSSRPGNGTPDVRLATEDVSLPAGKAIPVELRFNVALEKDNHVFLVVPPAAGVELHMSRQMMPGVLTLWQKMNQKVARSAVQNPPQGSGVESFAFWLPERRPQARNLALTVLPAVHCYEPGMVLNGWQRPWCGANAWAPSPDDNSPSLRIAWESPQMLRRVEITFDTDFDHPMESVLMGHPERVMPGCARSFELRTAEGRSLAVVSEHRQTRWTLDLPQAISTSGVELLILESGPAPSAIFEVRCY
ncbi:MAG: FAD-dependent oxidoreductase [Terracidiphilus sp.]|nr:FAD-dependent oxidoreductase [Terracidiphilus sp.]